MNGDAFRAETLAELRRLKRLAEAAWEQTTSADFFRTFTATDVDASENVSSGGDITRSGGSTTPSGGDITRSGSSIAVIIKHVAGNLNSRWSDFLSRDGEKPDRDRDGEFVILPSDTEADLRENWERGWRRCFEAIEALTPLDLQKTVTIRGKPLTVTQALQRQLSHNAYHVGQIVLLAAGFAGPRWTSLSIPRGKSAAFNISQTT